MKKYIFILFATCLFASCNNDNLLNNHWGGIRSEFEETNRSFVEVMSSADYWINSYSDLYYYTEPNGKGKSFSYTLTPAGGGSRMFALLLDNLRNYHHDTTSGFPGYYFTDLPYRIEDDKILFNSMVYTSFDPIRAEERECYYKILDYDDSNILVETNSLFHESEGVKYPYAIMLLRKGTPESPNWSEKYLPYDEWIENKKQWEEERREQKRQEEEEYWKSATVEDIEAWIEDWLKGGHTVETIEEYFLYTCPELYESKIKSILDKYR